MPTDTITTTPGADIRSKANVAFYRGVTGDWSNYKWTTVKGYLQSEGLPEDVIQKVLTAITDAQNVKDSIGYGWQRRINHWDDEKEGGPPADLGEQIAADIDEAIAPLAPFAPDVQVVA